MHKGSLLWRNMALAALAAAGLLLGACDTSLDVGGGGGTGTATLVWTPPTTNADGSGLSDLAGYEIHYGKSPGVYTDVVVVNDPGTSSYVVENLDSTTYYFVMTAFDIYGNVSVFSNMATKTVN